MSFASTVAAGVIAAIAAVIVFAIVGMYLSGHGLPMLSRSWVDAGPIHMSRADVIMLTLARVAGLIAGLGICWVRHWRRENGLRALPCPSLR